MERVQSSRVEEYVSLTLKLLSGSTVSPSTTSFSSVSRTALAQPSGHYAAPVAASTGITVSLEFSTLI